MVSEMISEIANLMIVGMPLALHLCILTLVLLVSTAAIPILNQNRKKKIPLKYHIWLARITVVLATLSVLLLLGMYFGF